jgi:hypothetical protein
MSLSAFTLYMISALNGYKPLSNTTYYGAAATTGAAQFITMLAVNDITPRLGPLLFSTAYRVGSIALAGHFSGCAIREFTQHSTDQPRPSSPHSDA